MRTFASVLRTGVTLSLVASLGAATAAAATVTPGNAPEGAGPPAKVKAEAAPASTKEHPAATPKATPLGPAKNDAVAASTPPGQAKTPPGQVKPKPGRGRAVVDARQGTVQLRTAVAGGHSQTATFRGALFEIRQSRDGGGMTDLILKGGPPASCAAPRASARATSARPPAGRAPAAATGLWAKDRKGRLRTRGQNSVATLRGTRWLTRETCAGTLTRVMAGAVAVRDLHRPKTVLVRAGHSYLARRARSIQVRTASSR